MNKRRIAAAVSSVLALSVIWMSTLPVMASAPPTLAATSGTNYQTDPMIVSNSYNDNFHTATATGIDSAGVSVTHKSYNAMTIRKVLEIGDDSNVPAANFVYTPTVPEETEANGIYIPATETTLAVLCGVGADKIKWQLIKTNGTDDFVTDNSASGTTNLSSDSGVATLKYLSQEIVLTDKTDETTADKKKAYTDAYDDVLINSTGNTSTDSSYYAIKTLQLDFSGCGFTEPGVYRYWIQESGSNNGVSNDTGVTDSDKNTWRTIDVYVDDASYKASATDTALTKRLKISGYVMYIGKLEKTATAGANAPKIASSVDPTSNKELEDGLDNYPIPNQAGVYGNVNGAEAVSEKSEGFINSYKTHNLTFKKLVDGNQASKDKYFAFTVKIGNVGSVEVSDSDIFTIKTADSSFDKSVTINKATIYSADNIGADGSSNYGNNVTYVTGKQLKAGYTFYLQNGQYITLGGLPHEVEYTITEFREDYTGSVTMEDSTTEFDADTAAPASGTANNPNGIDTSVSKNTYAYTDTSLEGNAYATFTNSRIGAIPTGVLLSVAAPAGIGAAVLGGIIFLAVKRSKKDDEDEEE